MIRFFLVAFVAWIICITALELDGDDIFIGMVMDASRLFINW